MFSRIAASDMQAMLIAPGLDASGKPWNWWGYSSAVIVSAVGFSVWPHLFMRAFAADSDRTMKLTGVLYPTFQLFLVPILIIGFTAILAYPGVAPADSILPYVLTQLDLPVIIIGLVCAGTLAASMSSGDAILHSAASIGVRDGLSLILPRRYRTDRKERLLIRILVVIISLVAYYFAVISTVPIVNLLLGSYGGVAQIFPLVFSMFYWPRATGYGAIAGLLAGVTVTIFFLIYPVLKPFPLHEGIYGIIINILILYGVSICTTPESPERIKRYIRA
jgi:solute:Na+ symporter, SSS family